MRLAPILHLTEHDVRGDRRWTGRAVLAGVICRDVLVVTVEEKLVAVRNRCPHRDVEILSGRLDTAEGIIECPSHGARLPLKGVDLCGRPAIWQDGALYLVLDDEPASPATNTESLCQTGQREV